MLSRSKSVGCAQNYCHYIFLLKVNRFLIAAFKTDSESKYRMKVHAESSLDLVPSAMCTDIFDVLACPRHNWDFIRWKRDRSKHCGSWSGRRENATHCCRFDQGNCVSPNTSYLWQKAYGVLTTIESKLQPGPGESQTSHESKFLHFESKQPYFQIEGLNPTILCFDSS